MCRIMVAMDGSEHSNRALDWLAANLLSPEDLILVVMVVEPRVARSSSLTPAEAPKYFSDRMSEAMQAGRDIVDGVRQRCASLGIRNELQFVEKVSSSPGAAIVEAANEERVDLIVMGNRGLGKLRRTFLGSVSDYVLHHAHRAVAVVPPVRAA